MTELFQSGQAVIAVWGTGRVQAFANTGFPVDFVYPKEGAPILLASACPVAKANAQPLAHEFIKTLSRRRRCRSCWPRTMGYGPVNTKVDVDSRSCKMAPVGERAQSSDHRADWDAINAAARGVDQALEPRGRALSRDRTHLRQANWRTHGLPRPRAASAKQLRRRSSPSTSCQLAVGKGEFVSLLGPVGLRQDHDAADDRGLRRPDAAARSALEGRDLTGGASRPSAGSASCSRATRCFRT